MKIGFLGMGSMGFPMAKNIVNKYGLSVIGYDVVQTKKRYLLKLEVFL